MGKLSFLTSTFVLSTSISYRNETYTHLRSDWRQLQLENSRKPPAFQVGNGKSNITKQHLTFNLLIQWLNNVFIKIPYTSLHDVVIFPFELRRIHISTKFIIIFCDWFWQAINYL